MFQVALPATRGDACTTPEETSEVSRIRVAQFLGDLPHGRVARLQKFGGLPEFHIFHHCSPGGSLFRESPSEAAATRSQDLADDILTGQPAANQGPQRLTKAALEIFPGRFTVRNGGTDRCPGTPDRQSHLDHRDLRPLEQQVGFYAGSGLHLIVLRLERELS